MPTTVYPHDPQSRQPGGFWTNLTLCLGEPVLLDKYCQVCTSEDKETPEAAARPSTNLVESPRGSSRSGA